MSSKYIHGTHPEEQDRLAILNGLLNQKCLEKIELKGFEHILDIGSGLGLFSRMLSGRVAEGKVVGIEKETDQIKRAIEYALDDGETQMVEFRQGSAYDLTLLSDEWGSFDLVFMRFLLEHLKNPVQALNQAHRALKPGGRIILIDDDHANFRIAPLCPEFDRLWAAYSQVYKVLGNDPYIGRKLISHLHSSDFQDFKLDFVLFGSAKSEPQFMDYANNLMGILYGARMEIMELLDITSDVFDENLAAIDAWSAKPDAALWYAANWAEGVKKKTD
ncbi:MAG: methyltransferase domain-containing protein [Saprospiraceae bacterium]|nr:methyltransferase domain-containing protein [Saprospiraceae bacterium]